MKALQLILLLISISSTVTGTENVIDSIIHNNWAKFQRAQRNPQQQKKITELPHHRCDHDSRSQKLFNQIGGYLAEVVRRDRHQRTARQLTPSLGSIRITANSDLLKDSVDPLACYS